MSQTTKRGLGRPKGSKNKKTNLSIATVQRICEYHKFNPAEKLIAIANGQDNSEAWDKADRLKATEKLFDAVHGNKSLPGGAVDEQPQQHNYEIVFVESEDDFELPGTTSAEVAQMAHNH